MRTPFYNNWCRKGTLLFYFFLAVFSRGFTQQMKHPLPDFDSFWNYQKPTETRTKFLEIAEQTRSHASPDYHLQLQTQIARTFSLEAKFEEAHQLLDEIEKSLADSFPEAKVRYHLERGRTFNSAQIKDKASEHFRLAFELSSKHSFDFHTIDAAHMLAIAATDFEGKREWNQRGAQFAEASSNPKVRGWIGVFHNNMGWDSFEAKKYEDALKEFQICEQFHEERNAKKQLGIARWSSAKTLRFLGKTEEALEIQQSLLKEKGGNDESGYGYEELGELFLLKGEKEKAQKEFQKAYQILSQDIWLQQNEKERLERIKTLSEN